MKRGRSNRPTPSGSMEERAVAALHRTWQTIGGDYIAAAAGCECDGSERNYRKMCRVSLTGEDVQEAVSTCGFMGGYPQDHGGDLEAVEWVEGLSWEEQEAL